MCLYGYPDGSWELTLPEEMVPPGLPVPTRGINRRRDYMNRSDYLTLVAHHSDSWLMGVTFFLSTYLAANQRYVTTTVAAATTTITTTTTNTTSFHKEFFCALNI